MSRWRRLTFLHTPLLPLAATGAWAAAPQPAHASGAPPRATFAPCPEVACKGKDDLAAMFMNYERAPRKVNSTSTTSGAAAGATSGAAAGAASNSSGAASTSPAPQQEPPLAPGYAFACPCDREDLGRHTWAFLHSVAAYYPDAPSPAEVDAAAGLVRALVSLYPCKHCRAQLALDVERYPPRLESREAFVGWLCLQHNLVNELLGKPVFPCDGGALNERWRVGRPSCWGAPPGTPAGAVGSSDATSAEESLGQADGEEE